MPFIVYLCIKERKTFIHSGRNANIYNENLFVPTIYLLVNRQNSLSTIVYSIKLTITSRERMDLMLDLAFPADVSFITS